MSGKKLPAKTYPGFGLSMVERSIREFFAERCTSQDLSRIREYFANDGALHCAYCDAPSPDRWDHIHPVSRGGDTVPGNLVPACRRCDDSKQDKTLDEWAESNGRYRPAEGQVPIIRRRIEGYQEHFQYVPQDFEDKLSPAQKEKYRRIREQLESLRKVLKEEGITR